MTTREGRVVGLQRSNGGVPKRAVERAAVGPTGLEGDRQRDRRFHGGPERALCLYSQECLDGLLAEGHRVEPGALGENVTIAGLPWREVQPGARLRLGAVDVEVTSYTSPCSKLADVFLDGVVTRVSQKVNPGWSRVYARVLAEGDIVLGDPVVLTPSLRPEAP
jgi:MOSC domain-containing protein YiiM